ncbi:hypothetical protein M404DRAFT_999707 [Pisolithus tinctorius Marx 270]|uniref:Uncharacterized protein n=1 Tax=Pisolithus tinctorius Marx 270 TaxID=870435 RepID=A0A0C3PC21_PISTI|nr:hypothetical protein M404DRAFT_999707 [Pisolithus tinctorius Marx 270]
MIWHRSSGAPDFHQCVQPNPRLVTQPAWDTISLWRHTPRYGHIPNSLTNSFQRAYPPAYIHIHYSESPVCCLEP